MEIDVPSHIRQIISAGEEIITTFFGKVKFGPKSFSKVLCVLTTDKLLADAKKDLKKLALHDVISLDQKKDKLIIHGTLRSGDELKVTVEPLKNSGEKKDAFQQRTEEIFQNFAVFVDTASDRGASDQDSQELDILIKPATTLPAKLKRARQARSQAQQESQQMAHQNALRRALQRDLEKSSQKTSQKELSRKFCPNCGTKLPAGGTFCAECGTKVG